MSTAGSITAACWSYLRLGLRTSLCLAIVLTGHVYSHPTGQIFVAPSSFRSLSRRQETPSPFSSFNWWPYPSWGLSATTSATAPVSQLSPTLTVVNAAATTGSATTVSTLLSSSVSLVHITALPPASTESSVTLSREHSARSKPAGNGFNIAYLAPLFAVLAAIVGGVLTWLAYRYWGLHGRRRSGSGNRESTLLSGPPYAPTSRFRQGAATATAPLLDGEAGDEGEANASPRPPEYSGGPTRNRTWLSRTVLRRNKPLPTPSDAPAQDRSVLDPAEDDPFLGDIGSFAADATESPAPARRAVAVSQDTSRRVTSPDPYSALSDTEDAVPYETIRHKSIKRAILERIRFGTMRKPNYERGKTTEDDADMPLRANSTTPRRSGQHRKGHRRAGTDDQLALSTDGVSASSRQPTLVRSRSQEVNSPPGFRILVEDPMSGALLDEDVDLTPTSSSSSRRQRRTPDKFTRIPDRRHPDEKRSAPRSLRASAPKRAATGASASASEYSSPAPSSKLRPARPAMNRYESSILLSSPPLVTSPALESQLFFGSLVSPHPPQLPEISALKPTKHRAGTADSSTAAAASPTAKPGHLQPKKLRTQRSPPLLPFPTMAESSPFRNRLKKPPHGPPVTYIPLASHASRADSADSMDAASESFATAPADSPEKPAGVRTPKPARGTPAERYHARHTALERVDAILTRSWSERQDTGVESPNAFGGFLGPILGADFDKQMERKGDGLDSKEDAAASPPPAGRAAGAGIAQRLQGIVR